MIRKDQGEVAVLLSMNQEGRVEIESFCLPSRKKKFTRDSLRNAYLAASADATLHDKEAHYELSSYLTSMYSVDIKPLVSKLMPANIAEVVQTQNLNYAKLFDIKRMKRKVSIETPKTFQNFEIPETFENDKISNIKHGFYCINHTPLSSFIYAFSASEIGELKPIRTDICFEPRAILAPRKYKPVAKKVRPILGELPQKFRIIRDIRGDPLQDMPKLSTSPAEFVPTGRYSQERKEIIDKIHAEDFLWPEERMLMHHSMMLQEKGFAWDDTERGKFREDFYQLICL